MNQAPYPEWETRAQHYGRKWRELICAADALRQIAVRRDTSPGEKLACWTGSYLIVAEAEKMVERARQAGGLLTLVLP